MSFVAPFWLAAAAAVAVGVVIAHLFSTSVPPRNVLPTVRFVPEGAPLAVLRTRRISDAALLLLRLLAVALLGLALAGAHVPRDGPVRVVLADRSRAVASIAQVRDSVLAAASGAVLIAFDSSARRVTRDSIATLTASASRGSLSAALAAGHRALAGVSGNRDSTELVIVSPVVREEMDSATSRLLALWEGPVRVIRVAAAALPVALGVDVRSAGDDPLAAVIPSANVIPSAARDLQSGARIIRTMPTHADSLWSRDSGGVLVIWPAEGAANVFVRRQRADSQGGIAAGRDVVISDFAREFQPRSGTTIVRWLDGEPAATESAFGRGCVRDVAIPVDGVGDLALRESFRGVVQALLEPCGGARDFRAAVIPSPSPVIPSEARDLQLANLQIPRRFAPRDDALPLWLAVAAFAALIAEQFLRARRRAA